MTDTPNEAAPPLQPLRLDTSASPPTSTSSSPKHPASASKRQPPSPLSIDLSDLPPLSQPTPPSNTLLVTQLEDIAIFHPASLATIREHITALYPLHSFAPIKSLRRIICSFYTTEAAIAIRQHLDGAAILGTTRARVYFGEPTPVGEEKRYLDKPDAGRLFFISPPPSPPVGWEMKPEDPPNKVVHAEDLASKLEKLSGKMGPAVDTTENHTDGPAMYTREQLHDLKAHPTKPMVAIPENAPTLSTLGLMSAGSTRSRSSTVIYDPEAHGDSPALPAVKVEDYTEDDCEDDGPGRGGIEGDGRRIITHTSRPPVELMDAT